MLEKIGLPTKPSMRGGNWVLDASHCQGCSSQFTFINRKHHCRRCGGLFCNNCTQQRMVLRGQGDAPVRICEPCKKLEEAARFELRYGHRKRTAKANLKQPIKSEDEVLDQILGTGGKHLSEHEPDSDVILDLQRVSSSASCSNVTEERAASGTEWNAIKSMSVDMDNHGTVDTLQGDPGELRQQAVEEKRKYKILKAEGKSEEALQAFKRGKELERQAAALEIAIRKSRRMAAKSSNLNTVVSDKIDGDEEFSGKEKVTSGRGKEGKNDLAAELRDLGWSDADLRDSDKKKTKLSLEGELSNLLAEVTQKSSHGVKKGSIDKSEVVALKKKALLLKREGKLAEAKEELKRAKILEKQIEEQELLGEAEDSDDELYALINSMNEDKQDELILDDASGPDLKFDSFLIPDDSFTDGKFEVTDDDMHDPELGATLRSFGWSEEDEEQLADQGKQSVDVEALRKQVLGLKREALSQKRAGNVSEAMAILKKAKLLEKDLEGMESSSENFSSEFTQKSSSSTVHVSTLQPIEKENAAETMNSHFTSPPKSKLVIQRELLALKKKALTLRKEGRIDEAEEELKKGKVLEQQLEEMESAPRKHEEELIKGKILERQQDEMGTNRSKTVHKLGRTNLDSTHLHESGETRSLDFGEDAFETEVTEQDMHDPALLSVLKNLGWNEDVNVESLNMKNTTSKQTKDLSAFDSAISVAPRKAKRSKTDIQKELLAIKRKALALRRQGKTEEAEEELEKANALENQIAEMEALSNANFMEVDSLGSGNLVLPNSSAKNQASGNAQSSAGSLASSFAVNRIPNDEVVALQNVAGVGLAVKDDKMKAPGASSTLPISLLIDSQMSEKSGLLDEGILVGSSFSRQPNQTQKMAELLPSNDAKALHSSINNSVKREVKREETDVNISSISGSSIKPNIHNISKDNESTKASHTKSGYQNFQSKETDASKIDSSLSLEQKLAHGVDALKDEILARKKKAVVLKREGKLAEAREELRQAKLLEKNLDHSPQDIVVKEVASTSTFDNNTSVKQDNKTSPPQKPISGRDRFKMQQESLSHKRNALKLRRAGKIDEAEAELELAKSLEKQLEEFDQGSSTNMSGGKSEGMDDVAVEDLLDPQLISALKAIGMDNTAVTSQPQKKTEPEPNFDRRGNHQVEKADLEEQIRTEKLRALNFKREGKQADALEALRSAKRLEKKLASLS